jgi:elongation factor G
MSLLSITLSPNSEDDRRRLVDALAILNAEDPSLVVRSVDEANVVVAAIGEHQLEILLDRLKREYGVHASIGVPSVVYKETITRVAEGEAKHAYRRHGRGHYAHVKLRVTPGLQGSGRNIEDQVIGEAIPTRFHESVDRGIRESLDRGTLGYEMDDIVVTFAMAPTTSRIRRTLRSERLPRWRCGVRCGNRHPSCSSRS